MIKLAPGEQNETIKKISAFYEKYNPGFTFDYTFLDAEYQAQYVAEQRVGTAIALLCRPCHTHLRPRLVRARGIHCRTSPERDRHPQGLGAGELGIIFLLSGDFTRIVLIAMLARAATSASGWRHTREPMAFAVITT